MTLYFLSFKAQFAIAHLLEGVKAHLNKGKFKQVWTQGIIQLLYSDNIYTEQSEL